MKHIARGKHAFIGDFLITHCLDGKYSIQCAKSKGSAHILTVVDTFSEVEAYINKK